MQALKDRVKRLGTVDEGETEGGVPEHVVDFTADQLERARSKLADKKVIMDAINEAQSVALCSPDIDVPTLAQLRNLNEQAYVFEHATRAQSSQLNRWRTWIQRIGWMFLLVIVGAQYSEGNENQEWVKVASMILAVSAGISSYYVEFKEINEKRFELNIVSTKAMALNAAISHCISNGPPEGTTVTQFIGHVRHKLCKLQKRYGQAVPDKLKIKYKAAFIDLLQNDLGNANRLASTVVQILGKE